MLNSLNSLKSTGHVGVGQLTAYLKLPRPNDDGLGLLLSAAEKKICSHLAFSSRDLQPIISHP